MPIHREQFTLTRDGESMLLRRRCNRSAECAQVRVPVLDRCLFAIWSLLFTVISVSTRRIPISSWSARNGASTKTRRPLVAHSVTPERTDSYSHHPFERVGGRPGPAVHSCDDDDSCERHCSARFYLSLRRSGAEGKVFELAAQWHEGSASCTKRSLKRLFEESELCPREIGLRVLVSRSPSHFP
jgi:hypothetical protein